MSRATRRSGRDCGREARGAWLVEVGEGPADEARRRANLSRAIADAYPDFGALRDVALGRAEHFTQRDAALLSALEDEGLVVMRAGYPTASSAAARRYLSGGWLEELVFVAAEAAGADEALVGQRVRWRAGEHEGENEIDVLARFGERLTFFFLQSPGGGAGARGSGAPKAADVGAG